VAAASFALTRFLADPPAEPDELAQPAEPAFTTDATEVSLPVGPSEPRVIACLPASSFYHACLDFSGFQQTFQQISANFEKTTC
jgi:hypothetical protein